MTAFIPGQAVERITPTRHVRGTVYSIDGLDQVVMRIEEIVRGSFLHIENAGNLRAYDPHLAQLDAAEADAAADTLRDLLREAAEALRPLALTAVHAFDYPANEIVQTYSQAGELRRARAVLAKIEEALK